jgi:xanthine dehydrogenase YagS FAD-binding subunit
MRPFSFTKPISTAKAIAAKKATAQYIAGGTNLVDLMKKNIAQPETLVDITTALPSKIESVASGIRIGAMVRNSVIANDTLVLNKFPLIAKAVLAGASPQIRNMASTGGNLLQRTRCPYFYDVSTPCNKRKPGSGCSALQGNNRTSAILGYSEHCVAVHPSDLCVGLAALDASVRIQEPNGKITSISLKDFHRLPGNTPEKDNNLPPGALILSIEIPANPFHKNYAYLKLRDRDSYAFALVSVAAALHIEAGEIVAARLASGGVAHKPWRWYEAEKFLAGKSPTADHFTEAAMIAVKDIKPLSQNEYKKTMLKGAIQMALQNCMNH